MVEIVETNRNIKEYFIQVWLKFCPCILYDCKILSIFQLDREQYFVVGIDLRQKLYVLQINVIYSVIQKKIFSCVSWLKLLCVCSWKFLLICQNMKMCLPSTKRSYYLIKKGTIRVAIIILFWLYSNNSIWGFDK